MGDINKYPVEKYKVTSNQFNSDNLPYSVGASFNSGGFRPDNLNFIGPVSGVRGGQASEVNSPEEGVRSQGVQN